MVLGDAEQGGGRQVIWGRSDWFVAVMWSIEVQGQQVGLGHGRETIG